MLDEAGEVTQETHALKEVTLGGDTYFASSDLAVSGVYKADVFYLSLTIYKLEGGLPDFTPSVLAWREDGSVKHFIQFGRYEGVFDIANDMILNPLGDYLYVATTFS